MYYIYFTTEGTAAAAGGQMYEKEMSEVMEEVRHAGKHRYNLKTRFEIVKSLGYGTYGKVKLAIDKKTGQKVSSLYVCNVLLHTVGLYSRILEHTLY